MSWESRSIRVQRPHHLNRFGPEEGVFVRVGSTNRRADLVLIEEMRRFSQVSSLDEQPMPELNSEASTSELLRVLSADPQTDSA